MADVLRRWRRPLITGVAIWLLGFPLLTWHPATTGHTVSAHAAAEATANAQLAENLLVRRMVQEQEAAAQVARAAATAAAAPVIHSAPAATSPGRQSAPATQPAAAPAVLRANTIVIPRLGLNQPVGWYSDCLGRAAVPRWGTWRWSCAGANNTYIMAHNPGIFTPILRLHPGDLVRYADPSGRVHTYRVSSTTIVANTQMWPLGATGVRTLTLQTCWTWDGSRDFIVCAVEI
jgi:sortase (surface protein transpeptidase)